MINYDAQEKIFHLSNGEISYSIKVLKNKKLAHLYFGKALPEGIRGNHFMHLEKTSLTVNYYKDDAKFSMQNIRQEFPEYGRGDFREPSILIERESGSQLTDLKYCRHQIIEKKVILDQMPCTFASEKEAQTLKITLEDKVIGLKVFLFYTIFKNKNIIARHVEIENGNKEKLFINRLMSASFDLFDDNYEMMQFSGSWSRERHVEVRKLSKGHQSVGSIKGCSSAEHNPLIILKRPETTEDNGEAYGMSFVYSGNFLAQVEVDARSVARVMMGVHPMTFKWKLDRKEKFTSPEVIMSYSAKGLNHLSQQLHNLYRENLIAKRWQRQKRPILLNNWEATYFDFTEESIITIAKEAKALGIDLFVLDDGWFGKRNNDQEGLGDWYPNFEKLPNGIKGLSEKINMLGLKFGVWFEPEMVNVASELFKENPDYIVGDPSRANSYGRNQLVLDFSREEVVEKIYTMMAKLLTEAKIDYIKWDMNRFITEPFSRKLSSDRQGEFFHRYILGVYRFLGKVNKNFPEVLIESCASGGNRFDPGMLFYAPQTWTSDNTDAVSRVKIQYGTSYGYPLSAMGSHVSAIPNHQVGRKPPLRTRTDVAYFGTFGYELDPRGLSLEDKKQIQEDISMFKTYQNIFHKGDFYRLISPFEKNTSGWMVVSKDQKTAICGVYRVLNEASSPLEKIKLVGLNPTQTYHVNDDRYSGMVLMNFGLLLNDYYGENNVVGDYYSKVFILKSE